MPTEQPKNQSIAHPGSQFISIQNWLNSRARPWIESGERKLEERSYLVPTTTLLLVAIVLFWRRSVAFTLPQFFAEDSFFFLDALTKGAHSVIEPFAGYHHFAIRLVAWITVQFDPLYAPTFFLLASVLVALTVAAACFSQRIDLPYRPLFALSIVLVPHTCEVFVNLTNINWILALGLIFLLMVKDPTTPLQWAGDIAAMIIAGLSGPFVVIWLPLFAWRFVQRRTIASATTAMLALACSALHIVAQLAYHPAASVGQFPVSNWVSVPAFRSVVCLVLPGELTQPMPVWLMATIAIAISAVILWRGSKSERSGQVWIVFAAMLLLLGIVLYKFRTELNQILPWMNGDRYFYIQKVLLLWLLFYGLATQQSWKWLNTAIAVSCLFASSYHFRWSEAYIDYDWPHYAAIIRNGEATTVPVNPSGWTMPVPNRAHRAR